MNITCVRESSTFAHIYENEVSRRWYSLPLDLLLPLSNGDTCQLVFAGLPGSALGPDVRDAVLQFSWHESRSVGDVEFHVRASDWFTHQHHTDARYNDVILHVVLLCDCISPVVRQDGSSIPMCSLNDISQSYKPAGPRLWPCHSVIQRLSAEERIGLLRKAGLLRFEQKTHAFVEMLRRALPHAPFSAYDACLIVALAEGLGYGRDRAFFRAVGQYMLGLSSSVPEPLGRTLKPAPLDAHRLAILRNLVEKWRAGGAWQTLKKSILPAEQNSTPDLVCGQREKEVLYQLRSMFRGLGMARADILVCNIVLPFAAAVALLEHDSLLAEYAQKLYREYPGLSSNRVTRAMSAQLQLESEPQGACQQQGLHYIYQQTCREKRCDLCMVGKRAL